MALLAPGVPLTELRRFLPLIWVGVWLCVVSGVILLIAYPTKALTNPVFYLKLAAVATALFITWYLVKSVLRDPDHDAFRAPRKARVLALMSLLLWAGAIASGRLLAYTHNMLLASDPF